MKPIILSFFVIIFFCALFLDNKEYKTVVMESKVTSSTEVKKIVRADSIFSTDSFEFMIFSTDARENDESKKELFRPVF